MGELSGERKHERGHDRHLWSSKLKAAWDGDSAVGWFALPVTTSAT